MFHIIILFNYITLCLVQSSDVHNFKNATKTESTIPRIVGGQPLEPLEFPWMASLQIYNKHFCGATLINTEWLVTAAHCVSPHKFPKVKSTKVLLGKHSLRITNANERQFSVSKVIIHENYDSKKMMNDIALIQLNKKCDFNGTERHIKPIDLPENDLNFEEECIASGWGRIRVKEKTDIPHKVKLQILDQKVCEHNYKELIQIRAGNICAGGVKGKGICNGDSGGPLQCFMNDKWVFVGIASFTADCALKDYPSVFSGIKYYSNWIWDQMSKN